MAFEPSKHVNGRMWPPGVLGNPNGRPIGSRTVFSQSFLKDLASVWAERGRAGMQPGSVFQHVLEALRNCPNTLPGGFPGGLPLWPGGHRVGLPTSARLGFIRVYA